MPAITITDLNNAKGDVDHISRFTNNPSGTSTSRTGAVLPVLAQIKDDILANAQGAIDSSIDLIAEAGATATAKAGEASVSASSAAATLAATILAGDAALVGADTYTDEATGRAAVADGANFKVIGAGDVAFYLYHRTSSSVSELVGSLPSSRYVQSVREDIGIAGSGMQLYSGTEDVQPTVTDAAGNVLLGFSKTTGDAVITLPANNPGVVKAIFQGLIQYAGGFQLYSGADTVQPLVTDAAGKIVFGIDTSSGHGVVAGQWNYTPSAAPIYLAAGEQPARLSTGWNGFLSYGQSLGEGLISGAALSTTQPYSNITFGSGPRSGKPGNTISAVNTTPGTSTVIPLVEDNINPTAAGYSTGGESICTSAASAAVERAAIEANIDPSEFVIFASNPSHGGYAIANLDAASTWYQQVIDHATEAKARATAAGKSFAMHAISWMQGETDATNGTSRATYKSSLNALQVALNTDIMAITGQSTPVHFLIYQTPTSPAGGTPEAVQLAQMDAVVMNDRMHLVSPIYHLPMTVDGVHISNISQMWYGRMVGRAYEQLVVDGQKPDCIWPVSATVKGAVVTVKFRVPQLPLVLDVTALAATTDFGFKVIDGTGDLTLSDIQVVNNDSVQFTLNRALDTSPKVRYGLDYLGTGLNLANGKSGNLRDSTTDSFVYSAVTYPLWHVAPHFEQPIIKLEA